MGFPKLHSLFQPLRMLCPEQDEDIFLDPPPLSPAMWIGCRTKRWAVTILHLSLLAFGARGHGRAHSFSLQTPYLQKRALPTHQKPLRCNSEWGIVVGCAPTVPNVFLVGECSHHVNSHMENPHSGHGRNVNISPLHQICG